MRILHTADLHLDRTLFETRLLDDQAHVLDQIVSIARDRRPDLVVIAGDVFDRAQVRGEAVELLSDFLRRLHDTGSAIAMIPGNHDAPDRIGFAGSLLQSAGVHVCGALRSGLISVRLEDRHGPVEIHLLPYADPAEGREAFGAPEIRTHDQLIGACLDGRIPSGSPVRHVVVGHCFVAHGLECESERPLAVGGAGLVEMQRFAAADLVLLGHLHRPQPLYAGSILPYSFDEAGDRKRVVLIELGAKGTPPQRESIPLVPRRGMRVIEGRMADIEAGRHGTGEDYALVRLQDREPVLDAMARLRRLWPNLLHVERARLYSPLETPSQARRRAREPAQLFADFWQHVTGEDALPGGADEELAETIERARAEQRQETPE
jgi:exonuclease SbcD